MCDPRPHAWGMTRVLGRADAELLHQGDAVELRPDVGHATVLQAAEVHALNTYRLTGPGTPMRPCCRKPVTTHRVATRRRWR
jgi:hypothetical protein